MSEESAMALAVTRHRTRLEVRSSLWRVHESRHFAMYVEPLMPLAYAFHVDRLFRCTISLARKAIPVNQGEWSCW
jgi:hypothetical protein